MNNSDALVGIAPSILDDEALYIACNTIDEYLLVPRFVLAVVFGVALSIISICFNSFIFVVFVTSKQHRNSYNLYLLLLSLFDVFIGISYIAVISNSVLINWTASYTLKAIW
ncbi:hypothetical protein GCK32_022026 [Trichostrongylus colubriformis]|uniref:G-protein coupled receptors family 1 profile domain-containing protein n=1 Tax=Trichostrongylus colubriformis TaxID=6319 RepID=A0AAN8EY98_TRICO